MDQPAPLFGRFQFPSRLCVGFDSVGGERAACRINADHLLQEAGEPARRRPAFRVPDAKLPGGIPCDTVSQPFFLSCPQTLVPFGIFFGRK